MVPRVVTLSRPWGPIFPGLGATPTLFPLKPSQTGGKLQGSAQFMNWIGIDNQFNSIQHELNWNWIERLWIGIELRDYELELNWNWKPALIRIDQFNQFIFNSTPHFCMTHENCSLTSNPMETAMIKQAYLHAPLCFQQGSLDMKRWPITSVT